MIVVHGATGFTGGLVCRVLQRRGATFAVAGRSPERLRRLATDLAGGGDAPDTRLVNDLDPSDLDDALEDARVVINCAGPFVDLGRPVVEAAIRNEAHYLDTTGEQPFILQCAREHDGPARQAGVVISPASAFEYATGDCAAALLAEYGVREMTVCYGTTSAATSRGTKKSIVRMLARHGLGLYDGELRERRAASELFDVEIGERSRPALWFPGGEPLSVPRHHPDVRTVNTALVVSSGVARALTLASPLIPGLARGLRPLLDRLIDHTAFDPHEASDAPARFVVKAVDLRHANSWVALHGEDPYQVTAEVIVEAAVRLHDGGTDIAGYASVARCFDPREFIETLGIRVEDAVVES